MRKLKFVFVLAAMLFVSAPLLAQDSPATDPPITEQPGDVEEPALETPAWLHAVTAIVSALLGMWGGRTAFADKTGEAKAKAMAKVQKADELFERVREVISSGNLTETKALDIVAQWKSIVRKE
jgi:hypothetical protein